MKRLLFQRICAALLALSFVVGLPMQGTAVAVSAMASPVPWAGDAETPNLDGYDNCGALPAMSMLCPTVFCVGLTGVILETPEFARQLPNEHFMPIPPASVGLSITPDPDPPRLSI
jgi:hypothetical protein